MKKFALALILAVSMGGCAPTVRYGFKRCPTVYASLVDFTITSAALAVSALKYNAGKTGDSIGYAGFGMGVALASNIAECKRVP